MKKKWLWLVDVVYWGIIICSMLYDVLEDITLKEIETVLYSVLNNGFTTSEILTMLFTALGVLIMLFFFSLIGNMELTAIYVGIKIATRKFKKERLEKIDFENDTYYREKLPEYSPAVLSYIDDFELDKKDIVATLLNLELKKKIQIKDKIKIIDNTNDNLTDNEQYVFVKLQNNELNNINMLEFKSIVSKEACEKELVQEKRTAKSKINKTFWLAIGVSVLLGVVVFVFLGNFIMAVDNETVIFAIIISMVALISIAFIIPGATIAYISSYSVLKTADPYIRSKQGKEINHRLEGLKKYLKEFSTLDEKTKEHLVLWEEFLIYSVVFGTNEKIVDEVYSKIN